MKTIVLTGGGTAGHCIPCLALLPNLKKEFDKIYYIGSENGIEKDLVKKANIPFYSVPCIKLKREFSIDNLKIPFTLIKGIRSAGKLLNKLKPDVVFSKGGYVALPTVIAANKRKIPVIAHESDLTAGLANKISSRFSRIVLTSFPETAKEFKNGKYVGPPIRDEITLKEKDIRLNGLDFGNKKPVLLIMGGSSGSTAINQCVFNLLPDINDKFNVVHLCGKNKTKHKTSYKNYYPLEFYDDMNALFSVTNVCVARAGSNSLFELLNKKIPTVLIPLPKGNSRGDQVLNAEYFQKLGLVYVLNQNVLTPASLNYAINSVYMNRMNIKKSFEKYPIENANDRIVSILSSYSK